MFKALKQHLQRIQNSDEATKKRWLIGASAISMILVISLWLIYMKFSFESLTNTSQNNESSIGFWQIFKNGLKVASTSIWHEIKNFISKIIEERTITINNK